MARPGSNLLEGPGGVRVLSIGQSLQILGEPNIQPAVLAERGLGVASVARARLLAATGRRPLSALDDLSLFLGVNLHGPQH